MSLKRPASPELIANPFIKKRNLHWTLESPAAENSEPTSSHALLQREQQDSKQQAPSTAAIESGEASTTDHLSYFTSNLRSHIRPSIPTITLSEWSCLYESNAELSHGAHFVIHQHDHPVAGTHYDLRLQINETSSVSWAIMYGLPGDPNSIRLNRNATETRIHCLWNHLIETASSATGSLLIWDTGTYTILPRQSKHDPKPDPSSPGRSPSPSPASPSGLPSQQSLLHQAFQNRKIRLRLHGARLPEPYVINLRLTKAEDAAGRAKSGRKPKFSRRKGAQRRKTTEEARETSDEDDGKGDENENDAHLIPPAEEIQKGESVSAMEKEIMEMEDEEVRRTNAYPGATNSIGSVHQRKWYLSMDRHACGLFKDRNGTWRPRSTEVDASDDGHTDTRLSYPFYVRGADDERSVVTGRRGKDILQDEGVQGFIQRKGWKPVLK